VGFVERRFCRFADVGSQEVFTCLCEKGFAVTLHLFYREDAKKYLRLNVDYYMTKCNYLLL
jgi:hypothetical protein